MSSEPTTEEQMMVLLTELAAARSANLRLKETITKIKALHQKRYSPEFEGALIPGGDPENENDWLALPTPARTNCSCGFGWPCTSPTMRLINELEAND